MRHLFIIPTTSCQASCKYCFTPNTKSPVMSMQVLEKALPMIYEILGNNVNIGMQSNLWALDEEFRSLLSGYNIGISTSIDGPEHINDTQRCPGYFDKTFSGIELLHSNGISPGRRALLM